MFTFFALFVLLMQPFTYGVMRSLFWLFEGRLKRKGRVFLGLLLFGFSNGLIVLSAFRLWPASFRLTALWMVFMLFTLFAALAVLLLYFLLRGRVAEKRLARGLRIFAPSAVAALFGLSLYNAYTPIVRHYRVEIDKPLERPLRIGMASDLHLGILFGARQLDDLAKIMNDEKVDIILLPGDIMDDDTAAYEAEHMQPHLARLRAPLGVYATLGNHDLFGAQQQITRAIEQAGIRVLRDEAVEIDGRFSVVGRPDELDRGRLDTARLLQKADTAKPVILLDHRPTSIEQHARLPIDVQVSGHVHNGQVFPANLIVRALYRIHYGYEHIGRGHFFVTSGYGFWGVPLRLGSQSEVMIIDVVGKGKYSGLKSQ
ncbi:MAG: metallophosphoesterase [Neisseria sp.]|nr:metallophosphoesterase [Neisseria sp.]